MAMQRSACLSLNFSFCEGSSVDTAYSHFWRASNIWQHSQSKETGVTFKVPLFQVKLFQLNSTWWERFAKTLADFGSESTTLKTEQHHTSVAAQYNIPLSSPSTCKRRRIS
jgi:hypothetical protein